MPAFAGIAETGFQVAANPTFRRRTNPAVGRVHLLGFDDRTFPVGESHEGESLLVEGINLLQIEREVVSEGQRLDL